MTALERDVVAWTRAKLRLTAAFLPGGDGAGTVELARMEHERLQAETALLRRGVRLLAKGGK